MDGTAFGVGASKLRSSREAGREAARAAIGGLGGARPDMLLVMATTGHEQREVLEGVWAAATELLHADEAIPVAGCSTEGVILRDGSDESTHAVSVLAPCGGGRARFTPIHATGADRDAAAAGARLAEQVLAIDDARLLLLFPDGLSIDHTALSRQLDARLAPRVRVVGGGAGGIMGGWECAQYWGTEVLAGAVIGVVVSGAVEAEISVAHGCEPFGLPRRVTRAAPPFVYEIDGQPAFTVFREYLEEGKVDLADDALLYLCVGVELPDDEAEGYGRYVVYSPLGLDGASGAVRFGGGLHTGAEIQMCRRDADRVGDSSARAAEAITSRRPDQAPRIVFQFDCAGRGRVILGARAFDTGVRSVQRAFTDDVAWFGCYSYGEIAPLGGRTHYHNYTVVLCALYDA